MHMCMYVHVCTFADYLTVPCGIHVSVYCVYIRAYMCICMMHCILCVCLHVCVCACVTVSECMCARAYIHTYAHILQHRVSHMEHTGWGLSPEILVLAVSLCSVVASAVTLGHWIRGQVFRSIEQCRYD